MLEPIDSLGVRDSEGWTVRMAGRFAVAYSEDGRTLEIPAETGPENVIVDFPASLRWKSMAGETALDDADRLRVEQRLVEAFAFMCYPCLIRSRP